MTATLHWIIDPICGWSYGALPLINAVQEKFPTLQHFHLGGLYIANSRQKMTPELRERIVQYDQHIHQLTGVQFGYVYKNQLLNGSTLFLDSFAATRVLLTAKNYLNTDKYVVLLNKIQTEYYKNGLNITQIQVLNELIATLDLGITFAQWQTWFSEVDEMQIAQEIQQSRELMTHVRGHGFPTLVLKHDQKSWKKIDVSNYYKHPNELIQYLEKQLY